MFFILVFKKWKYKGTCQAIQVYGWGNCPPSTMKTVCVFVWMLSVVILLLRESWGVSPLQDILDKEKADQVDSFV